MNIGAPNMEVTIPTGIITGDITDLPTVSEARSMRAPRSVLEGMRNL